MALILGTSPWILNFVNDQAETAVPVTIAILIFVYSMATRYEYGLLKVLSMRTHLALDIGAGIVLALSPWIFSFHDRVYLPHVIFGAFAVGAALMTEKSPRSADYHQSTFTNKV